ncbi:hypothetical protein CULT_1010027 [[Clostridium] ultunense Esp]|uniref:Uncharacterized protein n=1 Tax=[Clostridium] ultunense Esp TaxID=1288971 RepID=M1Z4W4_9FIRM|nr:hypothetical protein [Schnuerera ultunensis]CCQ92583.1 hypothetical protein CULT_1010027 [[Clostridium] ultunense Esp]SHD77725.1 conserved protein of unknown function [[Clostridium] ultunense Esp]
MAYFNDKLLLISDSHENIDLFRSLEGKIIRYHFNYETQKHYEDIIAEEILLEFDGSIDNQDTIYIIHQDKALHLILTLIKKDGRIERFKLTEESILEVYYLNLIMDNDIPHIVYFVLISGMEKRYRIYHHYFTGEEWITNIVDDTIVRELLNPLKVFKTEREIILSYYNKTRDEQIYIKKFNLDRKEWGDKIKLTHVEANKLYLDILVKETKIHLTYCQYMEGNLVVKYERVNYTNGSLNKEVEEIISNPENGQEPTLIYYEGRLWVVWIEHENILSRYSQDYGNTWSPIYLWRESKENHIVKYKYNKLESKDIVLNYSFGKINPEIGFIGFGPIFNTVEIPLKKNPFQMFAKGIPKL